MLENIQLVEGTLTEPPQGCELICGSALPYREFSKEEKSVLKALQAIGAKYKLTNKPLDTVFEPREAFELENVDRTVVYPPFAISKKDSDGRPDWIVEFAESEGDEAAFLLKPWIYRKAGVSEYWVINPKDKKIYVYHLSKDALVPEIIDAPRRLKVGIYNGLYLSYSDLFAKL